MQFTRLKRINMHYEPTKILFSNKNLQVRQIITSLKLQFILIISSRKLLVILIITNRKLQQELFLCSFGYYY